MLGSGWLGLGGVESVRCFVAVVGFFDRTRSVGGVGGCGGARIGLGFFGLVSPWQFSCSRVRHDSS